MKVPTTNLGRNRSLAEHHGGGVAMKAVGDQPLAVDFVDRDRRQPIPRVGISFDREIVEPVSQVEVRVENEVVQRHVANIHRSRSHVAHA